MLFENVGTRAKPRFAAPRPLRIGSDEAPFAKRCRPAVVDWNGDGLMDVVTTSKKGHVCLFRQKRVGGALKLQAGEPLLNQAGKPFGGGQWEACDWDGDGDWDLITQRGRWSSAGPYFQENTGTNKAPRFKAPMRLKCWGTEITLSAHEHSFAAVDWYGTGKPDLMCGGESGLFYFFRRTALDSPTPPAARASRRLEIRKPR